MTNLKGGSDFSSSSSSSAIALRLQLSPKTVETYCGRLMQKLNLDDLSARIRFTIQHGLTPLD